MYSARNPHGILLQFSYKGDFSQNILPFRGYRIWDILYYGSICLELPLLRHTLKLEGEAALACSSHPGWRYPVRGPSLRGIQLLPHPPKLHIASRFGKCTIPKSGRLAGNSLRGRREMPVSGFSERFLRRFRRCRSCHRATSSFRDRFLKIVFPRLSPIRFPPSFVFSHKLKNAACSQGIGR